MDEIAKIRDRLNRLSEHIAIEDMDPEIDTERLGHDRMAAIYASIQELKWAIVEVVSVLVEQEEDKLRALGIDPDAEPETDHEQNGDA